jgi:hypothetical protein
MQYTTIITIISVGLIGCTPPSKLLVDADFSDREQELIQEALNEWVVATDGGVDLSLTFNWERGHAFRKADMRMVGEYATMHRTREWEKGYQDFSDEIGDFLGHTLSGGVYDWSMVIAVESSNEELFTAVVMHELGHYMALHTVHLPTGIMAPELNAETVQACIDAKALDLICQSLTCGPHAKHTCR